MLVKAEAVLSAAEVAYCVETLEAAPWVDGRVTAGPQSALAKNNLQIPQDAPQTRELGELVLRALGRHAVFNAAALPLRVYPPLFNRYDEGMAFGAHVDNAIRHVPNSPMRIRTDLSATIFLTAPEEYDGGELVVQATYGETRAKFAAGDMALYPATSLHRVEPITRGSRWASFFWIQSLVKDDSARTLLYDLDRGVAGARAQLGDANETTLTLTAVYHNLLRRWSEI
ncbi:MAG: Fe2+-dependent dioxygenase [Hyphomonadaceae bacterium]